MDDNKNIEVKKAFEGGFGAANETLAGDAGAVDKKKVAEHAGAANESSKQELVAFGAEQQGKQATESIKPSQMQKDQGSALNGSQDQAAEVAGNGQGLGQAGFTPETARDAWRKKLNQGAAQRSAQSGQFSQNGQAAQYGDATQSSQDQAEHTQYGYVAQGSQSARYRSSAQGGQSAQYHQAAQGTVYSGGTYAYSMAGGRSAKSGNKKPFIIFGAILGGVILLAILFQLAGINVRPDATHLSGAETIYEEHIGVLYIEGTIMEGDATYNHAYALDAIDGMMENDDNEGLMLYVNTPGGGVYESDELYLKIKEYQDMTGRPVYAYLGSQATSGGYYISAPADKIAANRNCWTGSIGVTMGNLYDISGLLSKYGISVTTITSGANKAMGDMTAPLTDEQRQILQSLVDDAYDQFVGIVAEGRNLDEAYVRSISDGRLYTAKQAQSVHLIDDIVETYDDAIDDMMDEYELWDCEVYEFRYEPEYGLLGGLIQSMDKLAEAASGNSDINALAELMESNNELPLQYMCEVTK